MASKRKPLAAADQARQQGVKKNEAHTKNNPSMMKNQPHLPLDNSAASQRQRTLWWLLNRGGLTALQGLQELDVLRPLARIHELRARGHQIINHLTYETTAKGCTHLVGQYFLVPSKQLNLWDWQGSVGKIND